MARTITQYYTGIRNLRSLYDREARKMPAPSGSAEELEQWQDKARKRFSQLLGLQYMENCPLDPEVIEKEEFAEYTREKVVIKPAPGLLHPLTVLVPKNIVPGEKRPAFLHSFGHGSPASNTAPYRGDYVPQSPFEAAAHQKKTEGIGPYGLKKLAASGYIVIVADSRGSGERLDFRGTEGEHINIGADNPLNNIAADLGLSKVGLEVWDLFRMADYACSRPDCSGEIGVGGVSGGGHQSLFYAALDTRVKAIVTSAWFYGFKDALIELPHNCSCNFVPELFRYFDICDIGSMVAPRAILVETGMSDSLNSRLIGLGNVLSQYAQTRESFELLGAGEKLWHTITDGGHGGETGANVGADFERFLNRYLPLHPEMG